MMRSLMRSITSPESAAKTDHRRKKHERRQQNAPSDLEPNNKEISNFGGSANGVMTSIGIYVNGISNTTSTTPVTTSASRLQKL